MAFNDVLKKDGGAFSIPKRKFADLVTSGALKKGDGDVYRRDRSRKVPVFAEIDDDFFTGSAYVCETDTDDPTRMVIRRG